MRVKKLRKIIFAAAALIIISIVSAAAFYVRLCSKDEISKKIFSKTPIKAAVLLYGTEKLNPGKLEAFLIYYERESGLLKIVSVNSDMVFFDERKIARNFNKTFFDTAKKDAKAAVKNFYSNLFHTLDGVFEPDFYIESDYETFLKTFENNPEIKSLIQITEFKNRDLQCLNQLETAENVVKVLNNGVFSNLLKLRKRYPSQNAPFTKIAAFNLLLHFRFNNAGIMFCDLPVKYGKKRIEPDRENIEKFFSLVYYALADGGLKESPGRIEIKNASGKLRMAEKAAWLLRDAKFDVLEWGNFPLPYEKTIIKDYKGNFGAALKTAEILKCGKIIASYNPQNFFAESVFIGKDCQIYDKLDKKLA
jgi:hypothetical protein